MDWAPAGGSIVTRARAVDAGIEAGGIGLLWMFANPDLRDVTCSK